MSQLDQFYREALLNIATDQNLSIDFLPSKSISNTVNAWVDDKPVGRIIWNGADDDEPYIINTIDVHPDYQRRGIGTALVNHVKQNYEPNLRHSPHLTDDGAAFSKSFD